jgi:uncharacterized protein involved in exopolysaccharide biosynthesis
MAALEFDLREYWAIARRRLLVWVLPLVLVPLAALGGSFLLTPKYQATTTILISEASWLSASVQRMVPQSEGSSRDPYNRQRQATMMENEIRSTYMLGLLIDALGLDADPNVKKEIAEWSRATGSESGPQIEHQYLAEKLRQDIHVLTSGTDLVRITVVHKDKFLCARIADKLAELFMEQRRKRELAGIRSALDFTDEQLEVYRQKQSDAEERLRQFQKQSLATIFDENLLNSSNVAEIVAELDATKFDLEQLVDRQKQLREQIETYGTDPDKWNPNRKLVRMEQDLLLQVSDYVNILGRYTWKDPTVVALNTRLGSELDDIENEVEAEISVSVPDSDARMRTLWVEYRFSRVRENFLNKKTSVLDQSIQQLKARSSKGPDYSITEQNLRKEVDYNREIYQRFLDQLTGSQIQQALQEAEAENRFRILENARIPREPVYPERVSMTLIGLVLGLFIGGGLVVGFELADHSFRKPEQVEEYLGVTVIGSVPKLLGGKVKA